MASVSLAPSLPLIDTCAGSPTTERDVPLPVTVTWSLLALPLTVTVSACPSPVPLPGVEPRSMPTCFTPVPDRSSTVMVSAPPRALNWICSTLLQVHRDVADIAEEPHAIAVRRDVDVLADVGAIEQQRVGAGPAFDRVTAVARIPDERVVAGAEVRHVVATAAGDEVVAVAADQRVVAITAGDRVVARAAIERELDQRRRDHCRR